MLKKITNLGITNLGIMNLGITNLGIMNQGITNIEIREWCNLLMILKLYQIATFYAGQSTQIHPISENYDNFAEFKVDEIKITPQFIVVLKVIIMMEIVLTILKKCSRQH